MPNKTINPYRMFTGAMVPEWLMERTEISPGAKLAYARLARYCGQRGVAYPRLEKLGKDLGVSKDQARRYVHELQGAGLIEISAAGFHRANRYRFLDHIWISKRGGTNASSRGGKSASPLHHEAKESQKERVTGQAGATPVASVVASPRSPSARRVARIVNGLVKGMELQ